MSSRALYVRSPLPPLWSIRGAAKPRGLHVAGAVAVGDGFAGKIRDAAFIVLAWTIFIGVFFHPVAQIVGLSACALALLLGRDGTQASDSRRRAEAGNPACRSSLPIELAGYGLR